jgi:hypothetical protein
MKALELYRSTVNAIKIMGEPNELAFEEHGDGGLPEENDPAPVGLLASMVPAINWKAEYGKKNLWYPRANRQPKMKAIGTYAKGGPEGWVTHYDAGRGSATSALATGRKNGYLYTALGRDGTFYQTDPINKYGWHAGQSTWKGRSGMSRYFGGTEIACAGRLENGKPWYYKSTKDAIPASEIRGVPKLDNMKAGQYQIYTSQQEEEYVLFLMWLKCRDPQTFSLDNVVGHDEIAPARKSDPGGSLSMSMPKFRAHIKARWAEIEKKSL